MAKVSPVVFAKQVRQEMAKVTWPTRKETTITLVMVLILAVMAALYLLLADTIIATALKYLLGS